MTVGDEVVLGDHVAARAEFTATHEGEFQGMPPTCNQITVSLPGRTFALVAGAAVTATLLSATLSDRPARV